MNKNARKLIPAVAMLLVSATMLSTASFAWFSMNSQVTATGMNVNVSAPASIMISETGETGTWATNITSLQATSNDSNSIVLGHASSTNGETLYYVAPDQVTNGDINSGATIHTVDNNTYANTYGVGGTVGYVDYVLYLATTSTAEGGMNVTLNSSSDITGFSDITPGDGGASGAALLPALRFAVLYQTWDESDWGALTAPANNVWCGADNMGTPNQALSATTNGGTEKDDVAKFDNATLINLPAGKNGQIGQHVKVTIRVWLEGEDDAAINSSITTLQNYSLKIGFMTAS